MPINFQENYDVIIAGTGIAAAFTAIRLLDLGFRPLIFGRHLPLIRSAESIPSSILRWQNIIDVQQILNLAGAVVSEGFEIDFGDGLPSLKQGGFFHVERVTLARAALSIAVDRGASVIYCKKLPVLNTENSTLTALFENRQYKFRFAVDATGRRAVWSRPIVRSGKSIAYLFRFPQTGTVSRGKILVSEKSWSYRIDLTDEITVGFIENHGKSQNIIDIERFQQLNLRNEEPIFVKLRPAFPQWTLEPCKDRMIFTVGDAAFAHNPIAGQGVLFALNSAVALSAVLHTCRELPQNSDLAAQYYREFINSEKSRHLSFLEAFANGNYEKQKTHLALPKLSPDTLLKFSAPTQISGVRRNGYILPEETILLNNNNHARWLGDFDILKLRDLCLIPIPFSALSKSLKALKLTPTAVEHLIQWCLNYGVLEIKKLQNN